MQFLPFLIMVTFVVGCSSSIKHKLPDAFNANYRDFDCARLSAEINRVDHRVSEYIGRNETNPDDGVKIMMGLFYFWPSMLLVNGIDPAHKEELVLLREKHNEIVAVAKEKNCPGTT